MLAQDESNPFLRSSEESSARIDYLAPKSEPKWKPQSRKLSSFSSHFILFIITSLFWVGIFLLITIHGYSASTAESTDKHNKSHHQSTEVSTLITGAKYVTCGSNAEEARALGCKYDILSNHWVPAPCMDQDAVDVYKADESWFGYGDENRTQLLTIDEMSALPFYYTNMRDHVLHCASLWKKQYQEFFKQRKALDSLIVDEHHTIHCADFLIRMTQYGPDLAHIPIQVEVGYAGCHIRD
ncbi:hypothetical protein BBP40_005152 [Aspergillus hancockii]|nr:hypothetical protein BBP40_005152 [Aspergillus hancockii]